jgi:L-alanine-DL-glutamate epimerase-like enolase superfamily enzyme
VHEKTFRYPSMKLTWASRDLHPHHVFRISRARRRKVLNVFVRIEHDGIAGYGEAAPNEFYDETSEGVATKLEAARDWLETLRISTVADIEGAWEDGWRWLAPSRAAQCAIDLALWDWLGRRERKPVSELAWGRSPAEVKTFCTLGLSTPEELDEKLAELAGFPRIKVKSDQSADVETVRRVRNRTTALLAVDANGAWAGHDLAALSRELARLGVAFIEQPLPPGDEASLPGERPLPVFADESCVIESDIERLAECFDGFNIKLVKCGGLTPARRMVRTGRALGCQLMVGCMLESSALIAAGAAIAQQSDYADLDGAWLIADDPFTGWKFDRGVLRPEAAYGLGVEPASELFAESSNPRTRD